MSQQLPSNWILLGYVTRAHGIQGALSYQLLHEDSDSLREGIEIALISKGIRYVKIAQILSGNRLKLEGISDRTEAEKYTQTEIWVNRSDFQELPEDEIYLADLMGFEAVNTEGRTLGQITGFTDNRAQHLVEINHELLVPFVKPILVKIDEDNKKVILDIDNES
jgi:16S rRNA processing protein RimM